MKYLSLFSGVEAASVAWHPLGWECVAVSEIEPFPCAVLAHRYPTVPNLGDVTKVTEADIAALGQIDLVVFGSPCQDLSVAGKRRGLAGERSGLFHTAMDIIGWARKHCGLRWALWENVPGAFSSNAGADFAAVVESMAGVAVEIPRSGWGTEGIALGEEGLVEWAVLDAQWFGVAQRRRRVFALADFGDWANRPPVLLESHHLRGNPAPRRETGKEVAGTISSRTTGGGGLGTDFECSGGLQVWPAETASTLNASFGSKLGLENQHINSGAPLFVPAYGIPGNWIGRAPENGGNAVEPMIDVSPCQTTTDRHGVAYAFDSLSSNSMKSSNPYSGCREVDAAKTLDATRPDPSCNQGGIGILQQMAVRHLTPTECERLQGFPDGYTLVPHRGKPSADGPRYKALGNSMAVPVMRWIGEQIALAELC